MKNNAVLADVVVQPVLDRPVTSSSRIAWVDHSKGFCILMVLLLHAHQEITEYLGDGGWVGHVVAFAKPFRMPDFFLIAGLFLGNIIDRPWREYIDRKVWHFLYFYLLWAGIYFVLFGIKTALDASGGDWSSVLPAYLLTYINPPSSLWFIHSLALFFLIVRLTRAVPWWLMLGVGALLHGLDVNTGWMVIDQFCKRFVFFYSGYLMARQVFQLAAWMEKHPNYSYVYLAVWAVCNQTLVSLGWSEWPGLALVLGYYGVTAVVALAVILSSKSWAKGLGYIGKYSIVLYLSDYLVQRVALKFGLTNLTIDHGALVLLLTIISVFGSLGLFWIAKRTGMVFLYQRPTWAKISTR